MWVLLLTLISMDGNHTVSVPGFNSESACRVAAGQWKTEVYKKTGGASIFAAATCVSQQERSK